MIYSVPSPIIPEQQTTGVIEFSGNDTIQASWLLLICTTYDHFFNPTSYVLSANIFPYVTCRYIRSFCLFAVALRAIIILSTTLLLCYFRRFDTNVYTKDLGNVPGSPLQLPGPVIGDLLDGDLGLGKRTWGAYRFLSFVSSFLLFSTAAVFESIQAVLALATLCISATDMGGSGVVKSGWRVSCFHWCMRSGCALESAVG